MRVHLVLLSFIPLLLFSCPEEEEERERERRADEELRGCRSCPKISILADENCPIGYECNAEWKMTTNVLSPNECSCSELKCADWNVTLAVNGDTVGKIQCNAYEWTLQTEPSTTTTSAVCAKSCGKRACSWSHHVPSREDYSVLDVHEPNKEQTCASAKCPNGIAVFEDNGILKNTFTETSLVCSSSGNWRIGDKEERYAMCQECMCTATDAKLTDGAKGACPPNILCVPPIGDGKCEKTCPDGSNPYYRDATGKVQSSPDIKCVGENWIDVSATEITCAYDEGDVGSETPAGVCKPLDIYTSCSDTYCDPTQLVYTPYKDGYRLTCKEGVIYTYEYFPTEVMVLDCNSAGMWIHDGEIITKVNCMKDFLAVYDCMGDVRSGADSVETSCKMGTCTLICTGPEKKFQYTLKGETTVLSQPTVKCLADKLRSFDLQKIENVHCV